MAFDIQEYKNLYIITSRSLIDSLSQELHRYFIQGKMKESMTICHRSAHSLKSQSLVMGYTQIGLAARSLETIFQRVLAGTPFIQEHFDTVVQMIGMFSEDIARIEQGDIEMDMSSQIIKLQSSFHS